MKHKMWHFAHIGTYDEDLAVEMTSPTVIGHAILCIRSHPPAPLLHIIHYTRIKTVICHTSPYHIPTYLNDLIYRIYYVFLIFLWNKSHWTKRGMWRVNCTYFIIYLASILILKNPKGVPHAARFGDTAIPIIMMIDNLNRWSHRGTLIWCWSYALTGADRNATSKAHPDARR